MIFKKKTYVIAEIGVNHNGSLKLAKKLVDKALKCKVDAVKFQTFIPELLVSKKSRLATYQKKNTNFKSQFDLLNKYKLTKSDFKILRDYCYKKKIDFISTPFDENSLNYLVKNLKVKTIKISSGDIDNLPFLYECGRICKSIILSTGMSNIHKIKLALASIYLGKFNKKISEQIIKKTAKNSIKLKSLKNFIKILHCTTEYPCPSKYINLKAIQSIKKEFKLPTGFSDHSNNIYTSIASVAFGAEIIEKHFTLNKNLQGPDHKASVNPSELNEMVKGIRIIEESLGDGIKKIEKIEQKNILVAKKSLYIKKNIKIGEKIELEIKRPFKGEEPVKYWKYQGTIAKKKYKIDTPYKND